MVANEGHGLCHFFWFLEERGRAKMSVAKKGKKNLIPLTFHIREEEDTKCHSKQHRFGSFF
jgi:hypothetical protein